MKNKSILLMDFTELEWKEINLFSRIKLRIFAFCFSEILEIKIRK